jgi:hypothetical protein
VGIEPTIALSRTSHAAAMTAIGALGAVCAGVVAIAMRGTGGTPTAAGLVALVAAVVSILPAVQSFPAPASRWGLSVLGAGMARMLVGMLIGLFVINGSDLQPRPFWIGLASGLGVMLALEVMFAISVLRKTVNRSGAPTKVNERAVN